jgi:hypothetical protein
MSNKLEQMYGNISKHKTLNSAQTAKKRDVIINTPVSCPSYDCYKKH